MGLLVEDRVDGNRGLASLAIADDQLSLATADWDQAVDSFQAGGPAQGYLVSHTFQCGAGRSFLSCKPRACNARICTPSVMGSCTLCRGMMPGACALDATIALSSSQNNSLQKAKQSSLAWTSGRRSVVGP